MFRTLYNTHATLHYTITSTMLYYTMLHHTISITITILHYTITILYTTLHYYYTLYYFVAWGSSQTATCVSPGILTVLNYLNELSELNELRELYFYIIK